MAKLDDQRILYALLFFWGVGITWLLPNRLTASPWESQALGNMARPGFGGLCESKPGAWRHPVSVP